MSNANLNKEKFSGWPVLVGAFLIMFLVQGGLQTFSVFLPSIVQGTGFTIAQVSLVSTFATIAAFLANLAVGPMIKKLGVKWTLLIGSVFLITHWFLYSWANTLLVLYTAAVLGGLAIGFATVAPTSVVINNWFIRNRATYMSLVVAGSMFGGAVLMPVVGKLIDAFGWRPAYRMLAVVAGIIVVLSILFLIVEHPSQRGQQALGADDDLTASDTSKPKVDDQGVDPATARRTLSFWMLLLGIFLIGCSTNIENFLPAFWQSNGLSVSSSSNIMGTYAFIAAIAVLVMGRITDKLGGIPYTLLTSLLFGAGTLAILFTGGSTSAMIIAATIPFAVGGKKSSTLTPPLLVSEAFGRKHYGQLIGYFTGMLQLGIALSNPIIGGLHTSTGAYRAPFIAMVIINLVGMALILISLFAAPMRKAKTA